MKLVRIHFSMPDFIDHAPTVNIHTHLIPFILWTLRLNPSSAFDPTEAPVLAFTIFALICLLASAIWHTMAGCAHVRGMQLCAQVDYVGIGWYVDIDTIPSFIVYVAPQVNQR